MEFDKLQGHLTDDKMDFADGIDLKGDNEAKSDKDGEIDKKKQSVVEKKYSILKKKYKALRTVSITINRVTYTYFI